MILGLSHTSGSAWKAVGGSHQALQDRGQTSTAEKQAPKNTASGWERSKGSISSALALILCFALHLPTRNFGDRTHGWVDLSSEFTQALSRGPRHSSSCSRWSSRYKLMREFAPEESSALFLNGRNSSLAKNTSHFVH